jgi:hypothetical protein
LKRLGAKYTVSTRKNLGINMLKQNFRSFENVILETFVFMEHFQVVMLFEKTIICLKIFKRKIAQIVFQADYKILLQCG